MGRAKPQHDSLTGHFLIAMPGLPDPNFSETVTYICVHNEDGAFGLIINRVLPEGDAGSVFRELSMEPPQLLADRPIHIGGPVHPGHVFVLHGPPFQYEATLPVTESVAMTNSRDVLESIIQDQVPRDFLLILGCAGWAPGQLEEEIRENSWLSCPADEAILFHTPVENRWHRAAESMGVDVRLLSETPGHA